MSLPSLPPTPENEPDFVNRDEAKKYYCTLHNGILRNAMQTMCGHRYCETCINHLLSSNPEVKCPANEEDCLILSLHGENKAHINPDSSARREILKLEVYCTFKRFGCNKIIAWRHLQKHEEECEFKHIVCPNGCGEFLKPSDLQIHTEKSCPQRRINCKLCKEQLAFADLETHLATQCPEKLEECPYKCSDTPIPRREMTNHLKVCRNKPKPCKFAAAGCDFVSPIDKVLKRHMDDKTPYHLELLLDQLNKIVEEMNRISQNPRSAAEVETENTRQPDQQSDKFKKVQKQLVTFSEKLIVMETKVDKLTQDFDKELKTVKDKINREVPPSSQRGAGSSTPSATTDSEVRRIERLEEQIALHDVSLAEMDVRFQVLETASYDGVLMWKIRDYSRRKQEAVSGRTISLYSQPFYSDRYGYRMCARVYLNGDGLGKNTHMSLFFVVMKGDYDALLTWPFQMKVTLMLLDQGPDGRHLSDSFRPDPSSTSFKRPEQNMNVASGCPVFVSHRNLENGNYLKDDTIFIKVVVSKY